MNHLPTIPLFPAGQVVATPGALALLEQANKTAFEFLSLRHSFNQLQRLQSILQSVH